jgi:hypothetical protein
MKPPLILTLVAGLAAACSQTEPRQAADANQGAASKPSQPTDAHPTQPATSQPAAAGQPTPDPRATSGPSIVTPPASTTAVPAPTPAPAPPPKPVPPPAPRFREVTIPAGTSLSVTVLSTLASNTSKVEDLVRGALAKPVVVAGTTAMPEGTEIRGSVLEVKESGRVKGKASIAFRFDRVAIGDETHRIQTARVTLVADDKKSDDVKRGGVGAGVGAIVGGVAGGGSGAAIGAVAGAAGTVLATKGREVEVAPGTVVTVLVQERLTVRVPIN